LTLTALQLLCRTYFANAQHVVQHVNNLFRHVDSSFAVCVADSQECIVALELGIAIPTQSYATDWSYTKRFVASIIEQLDIGWQRNGIQVGVVTYRGLSRRFYRATLCCRPVSVRLSDTLVNCMHSRK